MPKNYHDILSLQLTNIKDGEKTYLDTTIKCYPIKPITNMSSNQLIAANAVRAFLYNQYPQYTITPECPSTSWTLVPFGNGYLYFILNITTATLTSLYHASNTDVSNEIFTVFGNDFSGLTTGPAGVNFQIIQMGTSGCLLKPLKDINVITVLMRDPQIHRHTLKITKSY